MPIKFAITMLVYAVCLFISGYVTMSVAPPGAKPATALIIPSIAAALSVAAAVLSLMIKSNRKLGMIGIHVGLVLPLIIAAGSLSGVAGSIAKASKFNGELGQIQTALNEDNGVVTLTLVDDPDSDRDRDKLIQARLVQGDDPLFESAAAWRPAGYQSVGMISIAMLSVLAFVALLLHRPEIPKAEKRDETFDADES